MPVSLRGKANFCLPHLSRCLTQLSVLTFLCSHIVYHTFSYCRCLYKCKCYWFYLSGTKDFCLQDGFHAKCEGDEVVVIAAARYGRMRLSTCVTRDYGFVGCGNDVTRLLTNLCSGKRECHISNLEGIFTGPQSCPEDLKPYLEASWHCVKGKVTVFHLLIYFQSPNVKRQNSV